ncbi:MAG: hypothetical protein GY748_26445, partial [Planctomycetaceae bacterium]|nr:hypothetical protein [Planctomycetaceae bacterium]
TSASSLLGKLKKPVFPAVARHAKAVVGAQGIAGDGTNAPGGREGSYRPGAAIDALASKYVLTGAIGVIPSTVRVLNSAVFVAIEIVRFARIHILFADLSPYGLRLIFAHCHLDIRYKPSSFFKKNKKI